MIKNEYYYEHHPLGRLTIWRDLLRYRLTHEIPERIERGIAFRLPRAVAAWAVVRVASATLGNDSPDRLTYIDMVTRWEKKQCS